MHSPFRPALVAPAPSLVCTLTTHNTLRLGNISSETASLLRVRKTLRQATPAGGFVFDVATLARVQTPAPGAEQLTADLAPVLATLVVETDATGRLVRILNKAHLRQQWAALRPGLRAKYRHNPDVPPALIEQLGQVLDEDDALESVLARSPDYGLLFPPLYAHTFSAEVPVGGTALLARFVGEIDLPLRTEALLEPAAPLVGAAPTVRVAGALDDTRYRADDAHQALCALADQPNLDTSVAVIHHETYTFGPQHAVVEASRHTRCEVQGVVSRQITVLLHTRAA